MTNISKYKFVKKSLIAIFSIAWAFSICGLYFILTRKYIMYQRVTKIEYRTGYINLREGESAHFALPVACN